MASSKFGLSSWHRSHRSFVDAVLNASFHIASFIAATPLKVLRALAPETRDAPTVAADGDHMDATQDTRFLDGCGHMGEAIRNFDWSSHPLGPPSRWPTCLKVATNLMLSSRFPQALIWGPDLTTLYNDAFIPILGNKPPALGRSFGEVWEEVWDTIQPIAERALTGEATFIEDFPLTVERFGYAEETNFTFCYSPIRDEAGRVRGFLDTVVETTAKVRTERTARLLNSELAHRLQNTLATMLSMTNQTFRSADSLEAAQLALNNRVVAMSRAHALLTQTAWTPASIQSIVESSVQPLGKELDAVSIDGPPLKLGARQSLSLALALNELFTNATKYGALSKQGGRVSISWKIAERGGNEIFSFVWLERDGPAVTPPTRRGFGSRLIQEMLAQDFHGEVTVDYAIEGLRVELITQLQHVRVDDDPEHFAAASIATHQ